MESNWFWVAQAAITIALFVFVWGNPNKWIRNYLSTKRHVQTLKTEEARERRLEAEARAREAEAKARLAHPQPDSSP